MRLFVIAFLAIATAISVNALYFQDARRFAVNTIGSGAPKRDGSAAKTTARVRSGVTAALPDRRTVPARIEPQDPVHDLKTSEPLHPRPATKHPELHPTPLVRAIQKKLAVFGYGAIPQDGLANRETRAAILAVQFEQGLSLTGEADEAILAALYFLEAAGKSKLASSERFERDARLVKQVQDLLAKLGYASGPIDGQFDAKTREAIRRFEADRRLKVAGHLTERVLLEMVVETGKPFASKG